ncbi:MAG: class I SAM-dependent DNA methyltransferase [Candidatus Sigynarchaeota archaeon]
MKKDIADLIATMDRWLAGLDDVRFSCDGDTATRVRREIVLRAIMVGVAIEARVLDTSQVHDASSLIIDRLDESIEKIYPAAVLFPLTKNKALDTYCKLSEENLTTLTNCINRVIGNLHETVARAPEADVAGLFYERHVATGKNKRGIVYTPAPVCKVVVKKAMEPALARIIDQARDGVARGDAMAVDAAITSLAGFSVMDPACGTGPFLVHAFRLLDATREKVERITGKRVFGSPLEQVHGIDEDPLAVEIARFNVCLEAAMSRGQRDRVSARDNADVVVKNIQVGNAITGRRFQDPANKFDAVVGNPPYVNYKKYLDRIDRRFLEENYRVFDGQADFSYYFFELHARLLKDGGTSGQVSSRYFMQASHARRLREFLAGHEIVEIVDMNDWDIFGGLGIHPLLFFFKARPAAPGHALVYRDVPAPGSSGADPGGLDAAIDAAPAKMVLQSTLDAGGWCMLSPEEIAIKAKFEKHPALGDLGDVLGGAETGLDEAFARHVMQENGEFFGIHDGKKYPLDSELVHPWLKNSDIHAYHHATDRWCIYVPPDIDEAAFKARYPKTHAFLSCFKAGLEGRDNGTIQVPWYAWRRPRNVKNLDAREKIVMPYKAPRLRASIDTRRSYCSYDVTVFIPRASTPSLAYIAGVLNSLPAAWFFATRGKRMGSIYEFYSGPVSNVRVPIPDEKTENTVVKLVQEAMAVASRLHGGNGDGSNKQGLERELGAIQANIDELVLKLIDASTSDVTAMLGSIHQR